MTMETIRVKSALNERVKGRYDGQDYVIEPLGCLDLSPEAASHMFGFGEEDKTNALSHLGWLLPHTNRAEAQAKLDQLTFIEGRVEFDEDEDEKPSHKTRAARPHGNASGKSGDVHASPDDF